MYIPSILYLTALHQIFQGEASGAQTALSLILIALIVLLFVEAPLLLYVAAGPHRDNPGRLEQMVVAARPNDPHRGRDRDRAYLLVSGIVDLVN